MTAFLEPELTTIALCWRLERRDGVALGFTTHDRDLAIGGLVYRAAPGMLPSAISLSDGFAVDTLDIEGALSSAAITGGDLRAGRWDGASVRIFMVDWEAPDGGILPVARGELGEISILGDAFEAELRGPTALLDMGVVEQTSPECRAMLGDRRCRVDMAARVTITRIAAVVDEEIVEIEAAAPGNAYGHGRLRWLGGANSGLESAVLRSDGAALTLREPAAFPAQAGDLIELHEGCDKSLATCAGRFGNAANFRGEPHLPGTDLLTRYPGA
jgi:uncharacterized phage protein (TIGR02218 family)